MQPVVRPPCDFRRQLIVHRVVSADQDLEAVRAFKTQALASALRFPLFLFPVPSVSLQQADAFQFSADLGKVAFRFCAVQFVQHAVEIVQQLFALGDQAAEMLLCALCLSVALVAVFQILLRALQRVQFQYGFRAVGLIVVFTYQRPVAPVHTVEVCFQKLCLLPDLLHVFRTPQFIRLRGQLSLLTVPHPPYGFGELLRPTALQLALFLAAIACVQDSADALARVRRCFRSGSVFRHRLLRQLITQAGKQCALSVFAGCYPAQAIEDPSVLADQNQVGGSSHQLGHQLQLYFIAELRPALQGHHEDTVSVYLTDVQNAGALQVFPQQHAEHRGIRRVLIASIRQMHARIRSACAQQQLFCLSVPAHAKQQQVLFRLPDLFDFSVSEPIVQFLCQPSDRHCIQCHREFNPP